VKAILSLAGQETLPPSDGESDGKVGFAVLLAVANMTWLEVSTRADELVVRVYVVSGPFVVIVTVKDVGDADTEVVFAAMCCPT